MEVSDEYVWKWKHKTRKRREIQALVRSQQGVSSLQHSLDPYQSHVSSIFLFKSCNYHMCVCGWVGVWVLFCVLLIGLSPGNYLLLVIHHYFDDNIVYHNTDFM